MITKKKTTLLILFVLSLFLIIGSVSAGNIELNSSDSTEFLNIIESRSDGDIVTLNPDGVYNLDEYTVDIRINNNITIKSSSSSENAIIDCNKKGRAFLVESPGQLTLINITIINGYDYYNHGGAIYNGWGGILNLTGCTFTNNSVESGGGAICNDGGSVSLTSCNFISNSAYNGGAIYNAWGATLSLTTCTFDNNEANDGGAIYNNEGTIDLEGCNFTSNSADKGGAIFSETVSLNLTSCNFISNSADYEGGAICSRNCEVSLTACNFISNSADGEGGAIYNDCCNLDLTACNFINNTANINGGAICSYSGEYLTLTAESCIFTNNKATSSGNIVYNDEGPVTLTNCAITYGVATGVMFHNVNLVNPTYYDALILEIESTLALGLNSSEYPSDSWDKFQTALNDVISMNDAKNASSQAVINKSINDLREAISSLISVNYSSLEDAINLASVYTAKGYTFESWNVFQVVLASAVAMNDTRNITSQEEINNIANALNTAREGLKLVDYSPLQDAINSAPVLDSSKYTQDSWAKYQAALKAVVDMNNNKNGYSQEEINTLLATLNLARSNLVPVVANENPVLPKADLTITKISKDKKKASIRYVSIKNVGKKVSGKFVLGVYVGKKLIKKVNVKGLKVGQTFKVKVVIPKKYQNQVKTFTVDIKKVVKEIREDNNAKKAK